jgi:hypothetical protein
MLSTQKLRETVDFYTEVLGFTCPNFVENWGWAVVVHDDVEIMFALPNAHLPFEKPVFTGSLYLNVENANEIWEKIKDGPRFATPLKISTTVCANLPFMTTTAICCNSDKKLVIRSTRYEMSFLLNVIHILSPVAKRRGHPDQFFEEFCHPLRITVVQNFTVFIEKFLRAGKISVPENADQT